ncbi:unnamed protein product [Caenorhabditis auriculariae]|uniref:Uncharacterized protein n=1 Tax=Caenorhabditis auriculariae TaxID=2777116 RepID=A0A8S1GZW2_9PELO|nr:unnamed protein product [Caenorhabditis auriculariae]
MAERHMMASTSHSPLVPYFTDYEDAVSSEAELERLRDTLRSHIASSNESRRRRIAARLEPPRPRTSPKPQTSSSENSSIEKLPPPRSSRIKRNGNSRHSRATEERSASGSEHGDWRYLNYAFQEMAYYPLLVHLNEQLTAITRQLNDVEKTNAMQLRVIMHLLNRLAKPQRSFLSYFTAFFRSFPFVIFALSWPYFAQSLYRWYLRRRQTLALAFMKYL